MSDSNWTDDSNSMSKTDYRQEDQFVDEMNAKGITGFLKVK
jgi:hypothetical protein